MSGDVEMSDDIQVKMDWEECLQRMEGLLGEVERGDRTMHELIATMEPSPRVGVARMLMGIADDIEPPAEAPTRGSKGTTNEAGPPGPKNLRNLWQQLQIDGVTFPNGNIVCARVFRTDEEGVYHKPDEISTSPHPSRVYHVERGVEMCLGVKNFMTKQITVEPFYVDLEGKETSEGEQSISPLGQSQLKLKSELSEGEVQDGWRLKDKSGATILTVYLRCVEA